MKSFRVGEHDCGLGYPAFLIAEVAQAHDGSLGMAHAFIDAAAAAGADAVKFQTHIAAAESTVDEPFRVKFSLQDNTRYAYWQRMEFSPAQWAGLAQHAQDKQICFLSSPFSVAAVELLKKLNVPAWKVGSGEALSQDLMQAMLAAGGPILVSTGMSRWDEIDETVNYLTVSRAEFAILHCTSKYPTPLEQIGLNVLDEMQQRYDCPIGLSDHSGTPYPALAAMARNVALVEVHVTFDRQMFGPDVPASVTFEQLSLLSAARDSFAKMNQNPVNKDAMAQELRAMRATFGKSLAPVQPLKAGTHLTREMLTLKKPATGIPAVDLEKVIGKKLRVNVSPDRLLQWEELEQ